MSPRSTSKPMRHPAKPVKVSKKLVFEGRKFKVMIEEYEYGGTRFRVEKVEHPGAAVVVPLLEDGRVLYLEQFRPAVGEWVLELPAGTIAPGEDPRETAARELEEEVGYRARILEKLGEVLPSPGYSSERIYAFLARGLERSQARREPHEILVIRCAPLSRLIQMVYDNVIRDAKTIAALILCWHKLGLKRLQDEHNTVTGHQQGCDDG